MAQHRIRMSIMGTEHVIVSDEPALYVAQLGRDLDDSMRALLSKTPKMTPHMAAVLTALTEHDRAIKAEGSVDRLREQLTRCQEENKALRAEVERLNRV